MTGDQAPVRARPSLLSGVRRPRSPRGHVERTVRALVDALERSQVAERGARAAGFLQRIDPRVKLAGILSLIVAATLSRRPSPIGVLLGLAVLAAVASRIRLRRLALGLWLEVFLFTSAIAAPALFLTPGPALFAHPLLPRPVTVTGFRSAILLLLRVETAATLAYLLVFTTPWPHVLKALRVFRVPLVLVAVLGMTFRYILLLLETARDMFEAQRSRTVTPAIGHARARQLSAHAGVLLSKTMALSGEVYLAMQARGFAGEVRLLDEFRMQARDWVALASFAALAAASVWAGRR